MTAAALLAGCQSGSATPLSLSGLTETADSMGAKGADTCPLPYDIANAAKAAGLEGEARPGHADGGDEPVATAEGGKRARPEDALAQNPGALVSCDFLIGQEDLVVHTVATRDRQAINPLAPAIQQQAGMDFEALSAYLMQAGEAGAGKPVVTASGNLAAVRLKLDGEGDAFLVVAIGDSPGAQDSARVSALAKALAGQVR
ncbi:hypothetical protein ACGFYQ_40965 [Streptomyces sp. NPDC048258]|uniref:hypothetical protein n=1 Tax=Streptomyces sp. NPDC048258 TaxID=3365527 RepID=UPI00371855C9